MHKFGSLVKAVKNNNDTFKIILLLTFIDRKKQKEKQNSFFSYIQYHNPNEKKGERFID
jgi:hypothetical protein